MCPSEIGKRKLRGARAETPLLALLALHSIAVRMLALPSSSGFLFSLLSLRSGLNVAPLHDALQDQDIQVGRFASGRFAWRDAAAGPMATSS